MVSVFTSPHRGVNYWKKSCERFSNIFRDNLWFSSDMIFISSLPLACNCNNCNIQIQTYLAFSLSKCFWCRLLSSLAVTLDISICTLRIFNAVNMKNVELQLMIKMIGRYKYKNSDSRDSALKFTKTPWV